MSSNMISYIALISSVVSMITAIFGVGLGLISIKRNKSIAIHEFLSKMESEDFISARESVYNNNNIIDIAELIKDKNMSIVVNFFQHWGFLTRKGYLPLWAFDNGARPGVIRLYEKTEKFIQERRKLHKDEKYADQFEWLYVNLSKK